MSDFTGTHLPCPCGQSSDAYAVNGDGWGTCFSCSKRFPPEGEAPVEPAAAKTDKPLVPFGTYEALPKRKIREAGILVLCTSMAGSVPDAADVVVTDPVEAGVMAVMLIADTAKFSIEHVRGKRF